MISESSRFPIFIRFSSNKREHQDAIDLHYSHPEETGFNLHHLCGHLHIHRQPGGPNPDPIPSIRANIQKHQTPENADHLLLDLPHGHHLRGGLKRIQQFPRIGFPDQLIDEQQNKNRGQLVQLDFELYPLRQS